MKPRFVNNAGVRYVRDHLKDFPRPDHAAATAIRDWAARRGQSLDPDRTDVVVLHHQWRHGVGEVGVVAQKMTLTQAVMANWQGESSNNLIGAALNSPWAGHFPDSQSITLVDRLDPPGPLSNSSGYAIYNGLFRQTTPSEYSARTHVRLAAEDLQQFICNLDFHSAYKAMLDTYWRSHATSHRLAAKIAFITACNRQLAEGSLDDQARRLAWRAAGLEQAPQPLLRRFVNIYGYVATDLLQISDPESGLTLLYIPGNSAPLHTFATPSALQDWVASQCRNTDTRAALLHHFALADQPDGLDFSGLATALDGLAAFPTLNHLSSNRPGFTAEGVWQPSTYVNYKPDKYSPLIEEELFWALTHQQRKRSYEDADYRITSNGEITKARWRAYLNAAVNLLAPLAIVVPELAPILALGGIAQLGLGLDQVINGHGQQERAEGVGMATFGVLNALPLAHATLTRDAALYRFKNEGFIAPQAINGRLGYPLSPVSPPRLPVSEVAPYFHIPDPIPALEGADTATYQAIDRRPRFDGTPDLLAACVGGYNTEVVYDLENDSFILEGDINAVDPQYYLPRLGTRDLQPVSLAGREVTDAMRMRTLRALGVELHLPVQMPGPFPAGARPVPRQFLSLWVGDKAIDPPLLSNLRSNAERLHGSSYTLRLYLSKASTSAFDENLHLLAKKAPGVQIVPLEEQDWFRHFREGPYHPQYQAALDGGNFASASDVLRYCMLHSQGGIYMDVDDHLLAVGEYPYKVNGRPVGSPAEAIEQVDLSTTDDGLLLFPPMSNEKLGMNCQFNTSLIGSHAGNPTLLAISEEMRSRYLVEPEFYGSCPSLRDDPAGFYRYAASLNRLTGPGLLTDVVDQHLPVLRTLRHITNLFQMPRINTFQYVNPEAYRAALRQWLPFNRLMRVGGNHSWAKP
ncbi:mannosyltransferase [Pseudomonas soli]|uniref:Mannosyltransferase n=1 Tax=Pseudomonas soli TaxID=1306993 RepID=A0AAJ5SVJ6_9PSED|nr:DUF6543 domain-containing protein [Pseudomonas soli]PYC33673.1 mannosyltransferase [Pseudomonas soli]UXZ47800.1 mannosyltransferase [Pseudomonas soli]